uniref:Thioredoxin domain-containing protein n=1 Tax=Chromera velia CCMP2878 TaxID=1169474 RepID=A0A0G4HY06_9ALVE|eukprot:Cvel_9384.t1-p1 / transcript=Cvel_9384.t1 / gene=Cvel_9384 / organism=Chromera_velia_CCMP2878 / gene_product=Thioredoxin, putative / transcript_product=Thioredoxin, putative / location=Cvel_scaffold539:27437-28510(-) / protein_length=123 / sequence_SO=supercontig / SO=protein_coding / is_pseudo=false
MVLTGFSPFVQYGNVDGRVVHLNADGQLEEIFKGVTEKLIVVAFLSKKSLPCNKMYPYLVTLSNEFPNVVFIRIDTDLLELTANKYAVNLLPSFQFYINGIKQGEFSGASENRLRQSVSELAK